MKTTRSVLYAAQIAKPADLIVSAFTSATMVVDLTEATAQISGSSSLSSNSIERAVSSSDLHTQPKQQHQSVSTGPTSAVGFDQLTAVFLQVCARSHQPNTYQLRDGQYIPTIILGFYTGSVFPPAASAESSYIAMWPQVSEAPPLASGVLTTPGEWKAAADVHHVRTSLLEGT